MTSADIATNLAVAIVSDLVISLVSHLTSRKTNSNLGMNVLFVCLTIESL